MFEKIFQQPTGNMKCEIELGIAVNDVEKGFVTATVRIGQYFRKVSDWLMSMHTEQQGDGLRHETILRKELRPIMRSDVSTNPRTPPMADKKFARVLPSSSWLQETSKAVSELPELYMIFNSQQLCHPS
jgi:hypothetical protein